MNEQKSFKKFIRTKNQYLKFEIRTQKHPLKSSSICKHTIEFSIVIGQRSSGQLERWFAKRIRDLIFLRRYKAPGLRFGCFSYVRTLKIVYISGLKLNISKCSRYFFFFRWTPISNPCFFSRETKRHPWTFRF